MNFAPPILAGVPGSFAHSVFHERHHKLIEQVIAAHPYPRDIQQALRELLEETTAGTIRQLDGSPPDWHQWLKWGDGLWGCPWAEAPFLWAESYFYRRLLQAVNYFDPGVWRNIDPFAPVKSTELAGHAVANEITALTTLEHRDQAAARDALLHSALWGNQADLSFQLTAATQTRSSKLLTDDSSALWNVLEHSPDPSLAFVADNAGRELLPDLVLIDHILATGLANRIALYVKPHPYYVSDATMTDTLATVHRLRDTTSSHASKVGHRLWEAMTTGRLTVCTHEFFCAPLPFHDMPADLAADLAAATVTVLKGDLNYRRLVGDRQWDPITPFKGHVAYFPSPAVALRTLKSDVVLGLSAQQIKGLDATGEQWRTNGEHALIQASITDA